MKLSQWYGCLPLGAGGGEVAWAPDAAGSVRVGALTVYRPDQGCEISTFGSADCPSVIIFDGYLFDRDELAVELGLNRQASFADLVAVGYQRWGERITEKFEGRFLIAVWDAPRRRLLLGRDALGRHPVYYAAEPGAVWFSSNVLAMASSGRVPRRPNRLSLALGVVRYWPAAGQTYFESISRLRPGHCLHVTLPNTVNERPHSDVTSDDDQPWLPEAEVLETFEPELERAVARCMKLGAQGIMLSGGVDSVTIAALAADYTRRDGLPSLVAVSGQSGNATLNYEERMQSVSAKALAMRHLVSTTPERLAGQDAVRLSLDGVRELASPTWVWWTGIYRSFYQHAASQGLTVLLTGSGGDDWLGVADAYAADLIRHLNLRELVRFLRVDVTTGGASVRGSVRRLLWRHGLRVHLDTEWARIAPAQKAKYHRRRWEENLPSWLCPDPVLRESLMQELMARRAPSLTPSGARPKSYYRHALTACANPYVYQEFETGYHVETLSGLRLLSPYHDQRLVRFFRRIPPWVLLHGNRYKGLLRPVVQKRLPQLGLENQRKEYARKDQERSHREVKASVAAAWQEERFDCLCRLGVVDRGALSDWVGDERRQMSYKLSQQFYMMSAERWVGFHTSP